MTGKADSFVPLAVIRHAHGVRGEVKIASLSSPADLIFTHALHDASGTPFPLTRTGTQPGLFICRIEGVGDRNQAEALKGTKLGVLRSALADGEENATFADELVGIRAVDEAGAEIGSIRAIVNYGASDIVVIATPEGEIMLPYASQFFPDDISDGTLLCLLPDTVAGNEA